MSLTVTDEEGLSDTITKTLAVGDVPPCEDVDGDSYIVCDGSCLPGDASACGDCDNADIDTYPGAPEICDRRDNDCDGTVDGGDLPVAPVAPAEGAIVHADSAPPEFAWCPGSMNRSKVYWGSSPTFARRKTSGKAWLTTSTLTPTPSAWLKILRLGKTSGTIYWMVRGRDAAGNEVSSETRVLFVSAAAAPTVEQPSDGYTCLPGDPSMTVTWDPGHSEDYKLIFSTRADLRGKPRATSGKGYTLHGGSWTIPANTWARITGKLAEKGNGTIYYAVLAKDALKRKTQSAVRTLKVADGT